MTLISILLFAWFLSWFGLDELVSKGIGELLGRKTTEASYWLIFFIVGLIAWIVRDFR